MHFAMPENYGPLNKSDHLSTAIRRNTTELKDEDGHALSAKMDVGECRYMDLTRKFDESPIKNKQRLGFVES